MAKSRSSGFGTARKLPSGRYQALYYAEWEGKQSRYSAGTFSKKKEATDLLLSIGDRVRSGTWVPPEVEKQRALEAAEEQAELEREEEQRSVTFAQFADDWLHRSATRIKKPLRPSTVVTYRSRIEHDLKPAFGDVRLSDITSERIEAFLQDMWNRPAKVVKGARHNGTAHNAASLLRAILRAAHREGRIDAVPAFDIGKRPTVRDTEDDVRAVTDEQYEALRDAMPEYLRLTVSLGLFCQLRMGEVLGLQRRDFTDDGKSLTVDIRRAVSGKTGKIGELKTDASRRRLAVPRRIAQEVRDHLEAMGDDTPTAFLFPGRGERRKDTCVSTSYFDYVWRAAKTSVGLPKLRFHDLRAAGLTRVGQQGATLGELMYRAGHRDMEAVQIYQLSESKRDKTIADSL